MRLVVIAVLILALAGCTTYQQQKADLLSGGPDRRVREAEQRQQAARDSAQGLESDREALEEERGLQEAQLADLNNQVTEQDAAIDRARAENRITRQKEQQIRDRVSALDREVQDAELQLAAARATADTGKERALRARIRTLEAEAEAIDTEIDALAQ